MIRFWIAYIYISLKVSVEILFYFFQFKDPPRTPPQNTMFNYEVFKKTTKENVLTRAILKQFIQAAAWDYHTLRASHDTLKALKPKKPENTKVTSWYNPVWSCMNKLIWNNVIVLCFFIISSTVHTVCWIFREWVIEFSDYTNAYHCENKLLLIRWCWCLCNLIKAYFIFQINVSGTSFYNGCREWKTGTVDHSGSLKFTSDF